MGSSASSSTRFTLRGAAAMARAISAAASSSNPICLSFLRAVWPSLPSCSESRKIALSSRKDSPARFSICRSSRSTCSTRSMSFFKFSMIRSIWRLLSFTSESVSAIDCSLRRMASRYSLRLFSETLPVLDALGDLDLALAGEQRNRAHLAQVHAHRVVGLGVGVLLLLALGALGRRGLLLGLGLGGLRLGRLGLGELDLVGLVDDGDVVVAEHRHHVVDLIAGDDVARQGVVHLVVGEEALVAAQREQVLHFLAVGGLAALLGGRQIVVVLVDVLGDHDLFVVRRVGDGRGVRLGLLALGLYAVALFVARRLGALLRLLGGLLLVAALHLGGGGLVGLAVLALLRRRGGMLLVLLLRLALSVLAGGRVLAVVALPQDLSCSGLLLGHVLGLRSRRIQRLESNRDGALWPLFFRTFQLLGTRGEGRCFRSKANVCECFFKSCSSRFASVASPACSISATASSKRWRMASGSICRTAACTSSAPLQIASAASRSPGWMNSPTAPDLASFSVSSGWRTTTARMTNSAFTTERGSGWSFFRAPSARAGGGADLPDRARRTTSGGAAIFSATFSTYRSRASALGAACTMPRTASTARTRASTGAPLGSCASARSRRNSSDGCAAASSSRKPCTPTRKTVSSG